tara:strand:- start:145 stop:939 length:795 start_codon:yes stop_codon:yes gene_type:complete
MSYFAQGGAKEDGFEVMLDSGAFSAKSIGATIEIDEYMEFVATYGHNFEGGYVALDVLGEPDQTQKNLDIMWDAGLDPMPVHVWGDTSYRMEQLYERASKICLGGFKRPGRGPAPREYVVEKMRMAQGRPVHWLGYTNFDMVATLTPHSCDAVTWKAAQIWGQVMFYKGKGRWVRMKACEASSRRFTKLELDHIEQCGATEQELRDVEIWVGPTGPHQRVTTLSWVKYILELRRQIGTRTFMALNGMNQVDEIKHAMKAIKKEI